ncbi:MAG: Transglutaminase-like protein [Parcubacteria group bacterium GW2011_GWC2_45_7]|nr:MAG: Transglutaminase-like protein [Parcubacteria group bacterium GW2011_GWC2_45_7]
MMKLFFYFLIIVLHFSFLVFHFVTPVFAAGEFETSFHSTYEIDERANATVTHRIELTNLSPNIYASEYSVTVGSTNVRSTQAFDDAGQLELAAKPGNNTTELTVFLDKRPVVGSGKTRRFFIQYQSWDAATSVGRILEVNAPKTANSNEFRDYSMRITVPKKFGSPSRIIPEYTSLRETNENTIVSFNKDKLKSGVTAVFGTQQSFLLKLTYYLENKSSVKTEKTLALVPDTSRQKVEYRSLTPRPKKIETDSDGNWLASYELESGEELTAIAELVVEVNLDQTVPVPTGNSQDYLGESVYWQTQDPAIKELADKLKTPKEIYDFVVETLSYDYSRAENGGVRRGAIEALNNPVESICTEFTDLFIALARAAGIPAREHDGFAYTTNPKLRPLSLKKDILHAWPEYWDKETGQWVEIDPTWAKTTGGIDYFSKLDLAHITFAIHGKSPVAPAPAGFYKTKDNQIKTVEVTPTESGTDESPKIEVLAYIPKILSGWKKNRVRFEVVNKSGTAGYQLPIFVDSTYTITNPGTNNIPVILPWQTLVETIELKSPEGWEKTSGSLNIAVGAVGKTYDINSDPPISKSAAVAGTIAIFVTCFTTEIIMFFTLANPRV